MEYFHGYNETEFKRLIHQAEFLSFKVFEHVDFKPGTVLLEPGCGVGAQTRVMLRRFPDLRIIAVDLSESAIKTAEAGFPDDLRDRVEFHCADIFNFNPPQAVDGVFLCWMLEHISEPVPLIKRLIEFIKPGGFFMATEVQNNSLQIYPPQAMLEKYWNAYNALQQSIGGDPFVGLKIPAYLHEAAAEKIESVKARPGMFLNDNRDPEALEKMLDYWLNLLESARGSLENKGLIDHGFFENMKKHVQEVAKSKRGLFSYTFIQTLAILRN
ncbi:MAG: methyltransferase domain-containing protein [Bacteroidia bacterium]